MALKGTSGRQLYCRTCVFLLPFRKGKCCPFLSFLFSLVLLGILWLFYAVIFLLGSFFESNFGSEFLFSLSCVVVCCFCDVLLMFLFYDLAFRSRARFGKFS